MPIKYGDWATVMDDEKRLNMYARFLQAKVSLNRLAKHADHSQRKTLKRLQMHLRKAFKELDNSERYALNALCCIEKIIAQFEALIKNEAEYGGQRTC